MSGSKVPGVNSVESVDSIGMAYPSIQQFIKSNELTPGTQSELDAAVCVETHPLLFVRA